jgi:hypothetical protein
VAPTTATVKVPAIIADSPELFISLSSCPRAAVS